MSETIYLIGAGPGAADLLTVRAARLLEKADVVLHDALVGDEVLTLARKAKLYNVGKRGNRPSTSQKLICRLLVRMASRHQIVVRLKGGDPGLFGRALEEIEACRAADVSVVIVPGISAAFAAAADAGMPLTARGYARSVAFVTPAVARRGHDDLHWARAAAAAETAVIYMGASEAARVALILVEHGIPPHRSVALIENAGRAERKILRGALADLPQLAGFLGNGPALMVIGEVTADIAAALQAAEAA